MIPRGLWEVSRDFLVGVVARLLVAEFKWDGIVS